MEEIKPFSKELSDENDMIAKRVAVDFLEHTNKYKLITPLEEQKEVYKKHDFVIMDLAQNKIVGVEVERKKVWVKSGQWQGWGTVDIPHRKKDSEAHLFVMVNNHCDTVAATFMSRIKKSTVAPKKTIYTDNELFFNVNKNQFAFYHKKEESWIKFM